MFAEHTIESMLKLIEHNGQIKNCLQADNAETLSVHFMQKLTHVQDNETCH